MNTHTDLGHSTERCDVQDGGQAFPVPSVWVDGIIRAHGEHGMTLRDYFAAMAMQGLLANGLNVSKQTEEGLLTLPARVGIPPIAYEYADSMLKARAA